MHDDPRGDKLQVGERVFYNNPIFFPQAYGMIGTVRAESTAEPNTYKVDFDEDKYGMNELYRIDRQRLKRLDVVTQSAADAETAAAEKAADAEKAAAEEAAAEMAAADAEKAAAVPVPADAEEMQVT